MSDLLPYLLTWLQEYGYPALWLVVFVAAFGIPLPINLLMLAAGAFAALGDFNAFLLALVCTSAAVCGDSAGYFVGRRWGSKLLNWLEKPHRYVPIRPQTIVRSRIYFQRRGSWAIFLSRFLVSALGGVTNILAGSELYPYRRFLMFDFAGESVGAVVPLALGYSFGASWEAIGDIFGAISLFVLAFAVTCYLIVRLIRMFRALESRKAAREKSRAKQEALSADIRESAPLPLRSAESHDDAF